MKADAREKFLMPTGILPQFPDKQEKAMRFLLFILLMMAWSANAQQWDDFTDEDLSKDPTWMGEPGKFKFSSSSAVPPEQRPALQLNGSGADSAWLSLEQGTFPAMQWEFWLKLSFNSSASNYARIYLGGDAENPLEADRALYIQAGGIDDSVWFARKDTVGEETLYRLPLLFTGSSTNAIRMKVTRSPEGAWHFYGDPEGGSALQDLGTFELPDAYPGEYFSLYCHFTSSNATKIYFDDIYCGPEIIDTIPPEILEARVAASNQILLKFTEPIDMATAADTLNYLLSGGHGHPRLAGLTADPSVIHLFFENEILQETIYSLNVNTIEDLSGNAMTDYSTELLYYVSKPYDVIINEIMADPSPPVQLPEFEYLELVNRTPYDIDMTGWELLIGGSNHVFPASKILASGYLILVDEDFIPGYTQFGRVTGLPSFSISNEGVPVTLLDSTGILICHTDYDPSKYANAAKSEGGWALERTDPDHPCLDGSSWSASADLSGGTPGRENSVSYFNETALQIEYLCCVDSFSVSLKFSQGMSPSSLQDVSNYSVDKGLGHPVVAIPTGTSFREVNLIFEDKILEGTVYILEVQSTIRDCEGKEIECMMNGSFSQPSLCDPFDLIFNEILFNPLSAGAEYLEIYNRSGKTIHLDELLLAQIREVPPNPPDTGFYTLSQDCRPVHPGDYVVLTKYPEKVEEQYHTENQDSFLKMDPFPALTNEGGKLRLTDLSHRTLDGLDYAEEMQYPLLASFSGIALERISPDVLGMIADNWHSASSGCGYGTPGGLNSQYQESRPAESVLDVEPVVFTPNGDGRDDVLGILSRFDEAGILVTVIIFNENGQLVRRLVEGYLAGTENRFSWDGLSDEGHRAPEGVYVIFMEALSLEGYSRTFKKAAVLAYGN
jgi:hypothetical protein